MNFGNLREMSVKIGKDRQSKKFRMPSGKRRMRSVSGRHNDDRFWNAPGVFRKASKTFFFNFRSLPSSHVNCRSTCRHRTAFFEVHYTPFTLSTKIACTCHMYAPISIKVFKTFSLLNYICENRLSVRNRMFLESFSIASHSLIDTI